MVSPISARLLAGTRDDSPLGDRLLQGRWDASSHCSSSRCSFRSGQQKRFADGSIKVSNEKVASNLSGYSGDHEDASFLPPVVSIKLHGRENVSGESAVSNCPKRQKTQEMLFAATTAKDDLHRAGIEFKTMDRDIEEIKVAGGYKIKLKGVRLIQSKEVKWPFTPSNVSKSASLSDYQSLIQAVSEYYPSTSLMNMKSLEETQPTRDVSSSSDRSTSSVSDTESDSESDNINNGFRSNQLLLIPPRVEDSLDPTKTTMLLSESIISCNVISCASNAKTMTESIELSEKPRLVTLSTTPYSIIHANAAFIRFSGKESVRSVLGSSFLEFLDPLANAHGTSVNLTNCMVASSMGADSKLFLLHKSGTGDKHEADPVSCYVRVSPIVVRKTPNKEVTSVSHFAIELFENLSEFGNNSDDSVDLNAHSRPADLAVGVMG